MATSVLQGQPEVDKMKPKRPLTAYNYFFRSERARLLGLKDDEFDFQNRGKRKHRKTHGMIGFKDLANHVGEKWKNLDPKEKEIYQRKFECDRKRYHEELCEWEQAKKAKSAPSTAEDESQVNREAQDHTKSATADILARAISLLEDVPLDFDDDNDMHLSDLDMTAPTPLKVMRHLINPLDIEPVDVFKNKFKCRASLHHFLTDFQKDEYGDLLHKKPSMIGAGPSFFSSWTLVEDVQPLQLEEMSPCLRDLENELTNLMGEELIFALSSLLR